MVATIQELEAQRDELVKTLKDLREAKETAEGRISGIERGQAEFQAKMLAFEQARELAAVQARETKLGTKAELGVYVAKSDGVPPQHKDNYRVTDRGAVRLTGHLRKVMAPDGSGSRDVWVPGLLDDTEPRSKEQLELQKAVEKRAIVRHYMRSDRYAHQRVTPECDAEVLEAAKALGHEVVEKVMADSSGIGASWVPDTTVPELERDLLMPTGTAGLFATRTIDRGGATIFPKIGGRVRFYIHAVPTVDDPAADPLSALTDSSVNIETKSLAGAVQVHRDWEEDAVIAVVPEIREQIILGERWALDDAIVHGDTTATHQDAIASWDPRGMLGGTAGLGGPNDHRRAWLGLVPRAYDLTSMTTDQSGAITWAGMRVALGKLGVPHMINGVGGTNICILAGWEYFWGTILGFAEFASWEKVGGLASVLSGQIGNVGATPGGMLPFQVGFVSGMIPLCIAPAITPDLAATGLFTGSGSTTGMLVLDRTRFSVWQRRGVTLEEDIDVRNNTRTLVARTRKTFRSQDAVASTVKDVHWSFNLPIT